MSSSSLINNPERRPPSIREVSTPPRADNTRERRLTLAQQTWALRGYGALLALGAAAFSLILLSRGYQLGPLVPTVVTAIVAFLCERLGVRVSPHLEVSVSFLPVIFAAVILGPISAMAVAFVCLLGDVGRPWERWVIWTGARCLVLGVAGFVVAVSASTTSLRAYPGREARLSRSRRGCQKPHEPRKRTGSAVSGSGGSWRRESAASVVRAYWDRPLVASLWQR
jgi:hypothetical protein